MRRINNSIFRNGGMHLSQVAAKYCGCRSRDSRLVDCPQRTANEAPRVRGSHHLFDKDGVVEIVNLQSRGGHAKPCQVGQIRKPILQYNLGGDA